MGLRALCFYFGHESVLIYLGYAPRTLYSFLFFIILNFSKKKFRV